MAFNLPLLIRRRRLGSGGGGGANPGAGADMTGLQVYIDGSGQSNMVGYVSFAASPLANSADYGNYASNVDFPASVPVYQADILAGTGLSTTYTWTDFVLTESPPTGDTNVIAGGDSNGTSSFGGLAKGVKSSGLFPGAASLRFLKTASPGQHIDWFRAWTPIASRESNPMQGFRQRMFALRGFLRTYVKDNGPMYMQAGIWWQGEQNAGAGSPVAAANNGPRYAGVDVTGTVASNGNGTSTVTVTANAGTTNGWQNVIAVGQTVNTTTAGLPTGVTVTNIAGWPSTFIISGQHTLTSSITIRTGNTLDPDIADYGTPWQEVNDYTTTQLGVKPPWFLVSLVKLYYGNDSSVLDPYITALNAQLKALCRYTATVGPTGLLVSVVDNANGGDPLRWYIDHSFSGGGATPNIHPTSQEMQYLGLGMTALLKHINGASGASLAYPITAVRPMWRLQPATNSTSYNTFVMNYQPDSTSTIYWGVVARGGAAPSAAQLAAGTGGGILAAGNFTWTSGAGTDAGYGTSGTFPPVANTQTISGLSAATNYDFYAVLYDSVNLIYSPVSATLQVNTLALPSDAAGWSPTFNTNDNMVYSNYDLNGKFRTVTRSDATGLRATRSTGQATADLSYAEILCPNAMSFVGLADSNFTSNGAGSTGDLGAGGSRVGWTGSNLAYYNAGSLANQAMGGNIVTSDVIQIAYNRTAKRFWMRRNNTGNWNNTVGADPNTNTGGLDCSGLGSEPYLAATLTAVTSNAVTIRAAVADWQYGTALGWPTAANMWTSI